MHSKKLIPQENAYDKPEHFIEQRCGRGMPYLFYAFAANIERSRIKESFGVKMRLSVKTTSVKF